MVSVRHFLVLIAALSCAASVSSAQTGKPVRVGVLGLDNYQAIAYTQLFNDPKAADNLAGLRVVAAFAAPASVDIPESVESLPKWQAEIVKFDVKLVDSVDELLRQCDVVTIMSLDGRKHREQAAQVLKAGKRLYIGRPLAASLGDAVAIMRLAEKTKTPCWTSSQHRFSPGFIGMRNHSEVGKVLGCDVYGGCPSEPHHAELYWHAVHSIETLYTIMGSGCVSVRCTSTPTAESITGVWADGRVGTYRGIKKGALKYSATVFGDKGVSSAGVYGHGVPVKGVVPTTDKYMGYEGLAIEMAKFFKGGPVPVSADETLEIFAFMEAAHESKRQKGSEVVVADILDKARRTVVATRPDHPDAAALRKIAGAAVEAKIDGGRPDSATMKQVRGLVAGLTDAQVRSNMATLLPSWEYSAARHARDRELLADIKRLGGKAISEVIAPDWLREIVGDDGLPAFGRIVEIDLNERTDGHKDPVPKKLADRVADDWLAKIADQTELRRLELSGTAVTSVGLVHLKALTNLERLNVCLTAVDDRGFEHLAGLTKIKRMVVCSSKITGAGFQHLQACKQIESINLHSSPASDAGLEVIGKLTSLRRLEIVHTNVTDAGLKHLAGLVNLQQLHIHGAKTTETALPFLGQLKQLYELDIYDRAASNQTLEQVGKLSKLRLLMLVNGNFDDDGVRHLAKLTTLEELSLDSGKLTEASIEHLAGMRNLRKLHLGRTKITAAGRDRLKTLLPTIEIAR